jgi:hypothetical protein
MRLQAEPIVRLVKILKMQKTFQRHLNPVSTHSRIAPALVALRIDQKHSKRGWIKLRLKRWLLVALARAQISTRK